MAAFTTIAATAGLISTAATTGMSFAEASKQRDIQAQAEADAAAAIAEAKKKLSVNYYKGLSLQKEPYELEREALNVAGAQAMEAAKEGDMRGVSATAGRVQMAQNEGQRQIATAQGKELQDLAKITADEEARLAGELANIDKEEATGAQVAAGRAANLGNQAMMNGMNGVTSIVSQAAQLAPLYSKTKGVKQYDRLVKKAEKNGMTPQQLQAKIADIVTKYPQLKGVSSDMDATKFMDYMHQQDPTTYDTLDQLLFYNNASNAPGYSTVPVVNSSGSYFE